MDFSTADICDEYKEKIQVLDFGMNSYGGKKKAFGKIRTVKIYGDNSSLIKLLKQSGDGNIAIVDVDCRQIAVVGDKLMAIAKKNGWEAIIVNGYVRDTNITKNIDVGLWACGKYPKKSFEKKEGIINCELNFLGVKFKQGDYLYADEDGIIISENQIL